MEAVLADARGEPCLQRALLGLQCVGHLIRRHERHLPHRLALALALAWRNCGVAHLWRGLAFLPLKTCSRPWIASRTWASLCASTYTYPLR